MKLNSRLLLVRVGKRRFRRSVLIVQKCEVALRKFAIFRRSEMHRSPLRRWVETINTFALRLLVDSFQLLLEQYSWPPEILVAAGMVKLGVLDSH